jgi:hypothetical protein
MLKTDSYAVSVLVMKPTSVGTIENVPKVTQPAAAAPRGNRTNSEKVRPPVVLDSKRTVDVSREGRSGPLPGGWWPSARACSAAAPEAPRLG